MASMKNKAHKDKCKKYKAEGRRAINKAKKAAKLKKHLEKCAAKYGPIRAEKEAKRKEALALKKLSLQTS